MTLKRFDTAASLERLLGMRDGARGVELPHLYGLVQAAADELARVGRECNAIDTVLVTIRTLETLQEEALLNVPHSHALVKRAGSDKLGVRGYGNGRNPVLYAQGKLARAGLQVPDPDGPITAARSNGSPVASKVERIDVLIVTCERGPNLPCLDVPNLSTLVRWRGWTSML
jgi:hypothetical protein